jgi:DNA-directed RNA polymerase specialized sigma24 family protein
MSARLGSHALMPAAITGVLVNPRNRQRPRVRSATMPDNFRLHTRPTPAWERRLIAAARRGDARAQARLLRQYDPLVQRLAHTFYLPGSEREDLAQEARIGILIEAVRGWNPDCGVPFSAFAFLCATRETRVAVYSARAKKHEVLTAATRMDAATSSAGIDAPQAADSLGIAARRRRRVGAHAIERAAGRDP